MVLRYAFIAIILLAASLPSSAWAKEAAKDTVVILHGIARTGGSMSTVEKALTKAGYETLNITYPSISKNIDDIAAGLYEDQLDKNFWKKASKVHFVTHSMGGLVTQRYLDTYKNKIPKHKLKNVVMLGPPNGGSEVADWLHGLWPYKWLYGPAGQELTTAARAEKNSKPYYNVGVIAGTREWPYFMTAFIVPGASDGRVSVQGTKLKGIKDHISIKATHTFIMDGDETHKQILSFLKNGKFDHGK